MLANPTATVGLGRWSEHDAERAADELVGSAKNSQKGPYGSGTDDAHLGDARNGQQRGERLNEQPPTKKPTRHYQASAKSEDLEIPETVRSLATERHGPSCGGEDPSSGAVSAAGDWLIFRPV